MTHNAKKLQSTVKTTSKEVSTAIISFVVNILLKSTVCYL